MTEELLRFVERLNARKEIRAFDEAATKQGVVLPLLYRLGWDTSDIFEVTPEYSVGKGKVDYSLRIAKDSKVFIEVKRVEAELEKHQEQLLGYSFREGVQLAILTSGIAWWFYLPLQQASWEQRKFCSIDVFKQEPKHIACRFSAFLDRENVASGKAVQNAEVIWRTQQEQSVLKDTLPKAWNRVVSEADDLLIELINESAEKICGHTAERDMIKQFLEDHKDQFIISDAPTERETRSPGSDRNRKEEKGRTFDAPTVLYIANKQYSIKNWHEVLVTVANWIIDEGRNLPQGRRYGKRVLVSSTQTELEAPKQLTNGDFIATKYSKQRTIDLAVALLADCGLRVDLQVTTISGQILESKS